MASRAIFDPSSCFPHPLLPGRPLSAKAPQARRISDYLEVIPIEGTGFGTVATQDVEVGTFMHTESPAAIIWGKILDRSQSMEFIAQAYNRMTQEIKARFDALQEGTRPFETREMRIWKSNSFGWGATQSDGSCICAIFLDMARINHSCLPNAEYNENYRDNRMELYSIRPIRAGEEVTICYIPDSQFKTGDERNAYLRYIRGFTCKCPACEDSIFAPMSDRRRRMLKEDVYCGIKGRPVTPDFSAKTLNIEEPSSIRPIIMNQPQGGGFPGGVDISRPGTLGLLRRIVKLQYDEGLFGEPLLGEMFAYAMAYLEDRGKWFQNNPFLPSSDPPGEVERCIKLEQATEILLRKILPQEPRVKAMGQMKDLHLRMSNQAHIREPSVAECQRIIHSIMSKEPDPFSGDSAYSRSWNSGTR
jgi:hypothetical protein